VSRRRYVTPLHLRGVEVSQSPELLAEGLDTGAASEPVRAEIDRRKVHAPGKTKTLCGRADAPVAGPLDRVTCGRCLRLLEKRA
jgi:hypothetical protein